MPRAKRKSPEGQHDPTMGPKVKDAKVLCTLGSGTFGTCYAVVLDDDKTLCCAKLARPKAEVSEAAAELWHEATMLQLLNRAEAIPGTSHIIRLLRFVDSSRGSPFILLELMDESLDKFLHRRGREFRGVSPTTMRSFAQQLLTGLTFLFDHGIGEPAYINSASTAEALARARPRPAGGIIYSGVGGATLPLSLPLSPPLLALRAQSTATSSPRTS